MSSNANNKHLLRALCLLVLLPLALMCLLYYGLTLLNGVQVSDPAMQALLTKVLGFGFLLLLYWLIQVVRTMARQSEQTRPEEQVLPVAVPAPSLTPPAPAPAASIPAHVQQPAKKQFRFPRPAATTIRKILLCIPAAVLLMALLQPSYEDFKAFSPEQKTQGHYAEWKKVHNYGLWSLYEKDIYERDDLREDFTLISAQQYRGMLLNFMPLQ